MTASLMAYVPTGDVTGMEGTFILPDFTNNRFYSGYAGSGTKGVSQFTGYVSGDVSLTKTLAQLGLPGVSGNPMCLTYSGRLIFPAGSGANSVMIAQFNASNLSFVSTAFSVGGGLGPSDPTRILSPAFLAPIAAGKTNCVIATPFAAHRGEICVLQIPGLQLTNLGNVAETDTAALGRGKVTSTVGTAYVLGRDTDVFSLYKMTMGLYSIPGAPVGMKTFSPADIDPAWSTFSSINGCVYDQTDDSVIIGVKTGDAVTPDSYVCKLDGTTGDLLWKVDVNYNASRTDEAWLNSVIKNGRLYVLGGYVLGQGTLCYTIDTALGTVTASPRISHLIVASGGVSEDISDSITFNGIWAEGSTVPNYIGTYMGDEGNHGYTGWMRLFPDGPSSQPAQPVDYSPMPVVSNNRAWTYTLDGHTFYVLDLGDQGTFVYDTTTQQWSEFVTGTPSSTYGTASPQWSMQNGCMWGVRIVAGGLSGSTVWEMTPEAVLDNDATAINHVATGGIVTRNRSYESVEAVRVAASIGLLDSVGPVNFNLRFSDDQGRSWSPYFVVALTAADYGGEIAWRSLGSFPAPGRIFELWDVGGLVRIDGMDVFLEDFDNDPAEG